MNYKLDCIAQNSRHTTFRVLDRGTVGAQGSLGSTPANCGTLTIQTDDLVSFLRGAWKGDIYWNDLFPVDILDGMIANAQISGGIPSAESDCSQEVRRG